MPPLLEFIQHLLLQAGSKMVEDQGSGVLFFQDTLPPRADHRLVTNCDLETDSYYIQSIRQTFPNDSILSEESGEYQGSSDSVWILDPIDGTQNYVHQLPLFCTAIAYVKAEQVLFSGIYAPKLAELYLAGYNWGATLNGSSIHVSKDPRRWMRVIGSSLLQFAWIAAGRYTYWKTEPLSPWDAAAGELLVNQSGGIALATSSSPLSKRSFIIGTNFTYKKEEKDK